MPPIVLVVLTSVLLLAMLGTGAGAWLEKRRYPSRPIWQNRALRDALTPGAGWCSLFVLDGLLTLLGVQQLPLGLKHLLGTPGPAASLLRCSFHALSDLSLGNSQFVPLWDRTKKPATTWSIRFPSRLAFPMMFVSAALAALTVLYYDGFSQNLLFMACIVAVTAIWSKGAS
jgi:hypothetical protein